MPSSLSFPIAFALLVALPACAPSSVPVPPSVVLDATDRSEKDRALDAGRRPGELLRFLAVRRGMRVADLGAGPGYTSELLARAVGPDGTVYLHNEPTWLPFLREALEERFSHAVMRTKAVVRVERPFEDPLPPEATRLDLVVMNTIYHDVVNTPTDRKRMNANILAALAPGGLFVVIDSSAKPGTGLGATETLHRIDEDIVRAELAAAGFVLASEATFLKNPADPRDWDASPTAATKAGKRGTSDRFVLAFRRPLRHRFTTSLRSARSPNEGPPVGNPTVDRATIEPLHAARRTAWELLGGFPETVLLEWCPVTARPEPSPPSRVEGKPPCVTSSPRSR